MRVATLISVAAATLLASAASAAAAPPGLSSGGGFFGAAMPERLSSGGVQTTWTPERIAAATPLDGPRSTTTLREPSAVPSPLATPQPQALRSVVLRDAASYPNRVHGKLVGTFKGLGDYACSATVVSSGSGSLLTTAGHCAYDVATGTVATNLAFAPGFSGNDVPYGVWPVTHLIVTKQWALRGALDFDFSMMRTAPGPDGTLQAGVGSRGIGFNQPRKQRLEAYGYPARGKRAYNGRLLVRCDSGYVGDPVRTGGPRGRGMRCDQQQGSSGGGWVAQHSFVVSNTSHGYPQLSDNLFFGPYYGTKAKAMYRAKASFWPSIDPVRCDGRVATIVGSDAGERTRGTRGADVIATLDGNDRVVGRGGKDSICAGPGNDRVSGGGGRDKIDGGSGADRCGRKQRRERPRGCESS